MRGKKKLLLPAVERYLTSGGLPRSETRSPQRVPEILGSRRLQIEMQVRGVDTIGEPDLLFYKYLLASERIPGHQYPTLCNFCIDRVWRFEVFRSKYEDAIEVVDDQTGESTITRGPIEFASHYDGKAVNWILGTYFRLAGLCFSCRTVDPLVRLGGMESSSALIGAATAAGSILSGADHDLGTIFTLATSFENDVLGGLTGGEGFAAGILGGANALEFPVAVHPYGAIASRLFGPDRYQDFEDHVSILLPGGTRRKRSSVDINRAWMNHARTPAGRRQQSRIAALSARVAEAYTRPEGIDWQSVATAVQTETDIRLEACARFFDGIEALAERLVVREGDRVLRAVTRPGAGGYGTPVTVYSATKELAEEARAIAGEKIDSAVAGLVESNQEVPRGWLYYRLASDAIRFTGLEDSEFSLPRPLVETEA